MSHRHTTINPMEDVTYKPHEYQLAKSRYIWAFIGAAFMFACYLFVSGIVGQFVDTGAFGSFGIVAWVAVVTLVIGPVMLFFRATDKLHEFRDINVRRNYVVRHHERAMELPSLIEGDDFVATKKVLDSDDQLLVKVDTKDPAHYVSGEYLVTSTRVKVVAGVRFDTMLGYLERAAKKQDAIEANLAIRNSFTRREVQFSDIESENAHHLDGD